MELHIEEGATLLASTDQAGWANGTVGSAIITADKQQHIAITGGGTVDGQGLQWWIDMKKPGKHDIFRPHTVDFRDITHAVLSDTLYTDGPNHILELGCNYCELDGVKVLAPPSTGACEKTNTCSHNTDGALAACIALFRSRCPKISLAYANTRACLRWRAAVDVHGQPFYIHSVSTVALSHSRGKVWPRTALCHADVSVSAQHIGR